MKLFIGILFGFMIGFSYGVYFTVDASESGITWLIENISKLKGIIETLNGVK